VTGPYSKTDSRHLFNLKQASRQKYSSFKPGRVEVDGGPDKFLSIIGTARTGKQWAGSRQDRKRARDRTERRQTRESSFYAALDSFLQDHHHELKDCGYERDLFGMLQDSHHLEEFSRGVTFERDRFMDICKQFRTFGGEHKFFSRVGSYIKSGMPNCSAEIRAGMTSYQVWRREVAKVMSFTGAQLGHSEKVINKTALKRLK